MDLQPGNRVTITVTSDLKRASAQKTLARLFLKDPAIAELRLKDPKPYKEKIRGGRFWRHTKSGSAAIVPRRGESATLTTTLDIIRDIKSVSNYVELK